MYHLIILPLLPEVPDVQLAVRSEDTVNTSQQNGNILRPPILPSAPDTQIGG